VPVEGSFRVERDFLLYELNPHLHYRGRYVGYEALYPDGRIETLLNVPTYDFDWQRDYRFAVAKHLPAGTTLRVKGAWDNSPENLSNLSCRLSLTASAPTLITAFGVPNTLPRPRLSLYRSDGTRVSQVSGWVDTPELQAAQRATGAFAFASGSADAALLVSLEPGSYTAHVDGGTGETLVEVYRIP
jgi:hypothetical protein